LPKKGRSIRCALGTEGSRAKHDRHLYRIARSVLLDDHEAEDAVQETYVLAFTRLADFRGDASLSTWLARIALNESLKRRRRRPRTVDLDVIDAARDGSDMQNYRSPMIAPDQDPERAIAQHQLRRFLERAIDDLPETFRTVFVMRAIEEATTEETATLLGIRQQTVKTRLHRARRMLRAALGEHIGAAVKCVSVRQTRCDRLVKKVLEQLGFAFVKSVSR
jgi:RNA polymerase sigma-70 factor (ECF subfamily)